MLTLWTESCVGCADSLSLASFYQDEFGSDGFLVLTVNEGDQLGAFRSRGYARELAPAVLRLEDVHKLVRLRFGADPAVRWILVSRTGHVAGYGHDTGPSREMVLAAATR
jgi:hypothetical protein